MKRLPVLLLVSSALLLLGGCAIEPTYHYTRTADGGGYYNGQSAYGDADTVVYGGVYADPWAWDPWWGGYYGPRWGWGGVGFGATYTYRSHHRYRAHPRSVHHGHQHRQPQHRHWHQHRQSPYRTDSRHAGDRHPGH